jgi:hypothetical protein
MSGESISQLPRLSIQSSRQIPQKPFSQFAISPTEDTDMNSREEQEKMRRGKEVEKSMNLAWTEPNESVNLPALFGSSSDNRFPPCRTVVALSLYRR